MTFEVGQEVTVISNDYMQGLPGLVLDVSSSDDLGGNQYTVEVEDCGTQYFYGRSLEIREN